MKLSEKILQVKPSATLSINAMAKKMRSEGIDVIGFAAGEPDFNTPEYINKAAHQAIDDGFTKYTDSSGMEPLRKAVAQKLAEDNGLHYDYTQIIISNGAKHSLANIFTAILNDGDEVLLLAPYWLSYAQMVIIAGGKPVVVMSEAKNGFKPELENLEAAVTSKTKAIVINSPSNPSGMILKRPELEMLAAFAKKHDLFVISDEIYEKLVYEQENPHISIASLNDDIFARTIVVNGLSKSHAMTGWRIGYTASNPTVAKVMGSIQSHCASNPNSIAQKAALAALTQPSDSVQSMCEAFKKRRDVIYEEALKIPMAEVIKPQGAFYLFINLEKLIGKTYKGKEMKDAVDLAAAMLEDYKVAVVPCNDFAYPGYIRLSYAMAMDQITNGMQRIQNFVSENFN